LVAADTAASCDETVHVAVLHGTDVVYIAKVDSTHPVRMVSAVGRRLPAHCTAVGKVLLSGLPTEAFEARYPQGGELAAMTPHSLTSLSALRSHLVEVDEAGVAYDNCESNEAVGCVAAGVYDSSGSMAAAMSISTPIIRWSEQRRAEWTELVRRGAADLSRRLGYRGDRTF
jgi:DNA-binding IclR family transcriptional regulator